MLCAYKRPRYQVSVYRTIGPLVLIISQWKLVNKISQEPLEPVIIFGSQIVSKV